MGTNSKVTCSVEIGHSYPLEITRYGPGLRPYGMIDNTPVIIGEKDDKNINEDPYRTRPGDKVIVTVNDIIKTCAFARVEENCGTFIEKGHKGTVMLTGQSTNDARDAVSVPEQGGGFCGVFTIVKYAKPGYPGNDKKKRECYVRVGALKGGSEGRRFVITYNVDSRQERPFHREMYISQWPPLKLVGSAEPLPEENGIPILGELPNMRIGVPKYTRAMLFFGDGGFKKILEKGGRGHDATGLNPADAVDEYYGRNGEDAFRLGLATPYSIGSMRQAIKDSVFDLIAEDLPV